MHPDNRLALAAVVSPPIGFMALALATGASAAIAGRTPWHEVVAWLPLAPFLFIVYGALSCYMAEFVVGWPAYLWLKRTNRLRIAWAMAFGSIAGSIALAFPMTFGFAFPRASELPSILAYGCTCGAVAGAAFWLIAFARASDHTVNA